MRLKGSSFRRCRAARRGKRSAHIAARKRVSRPHDPQAGIQRQWPVPHPRAPQLGDRPRHDLDDERPLRRDADRVKRGKVAVRDFRRKKTIVVKAGKKYLAKAKAR